MTDQQIKEQLSRLKIFGNLDQSEFSEYSRVMRFIGYSECLQAVDLLIDTYTKHSFPLPAEIRNAAKEISEKRLMQYEQQAKAAIYGSGSLKVTQAFASAFKLGWLIKDGKVRCEYWQEKLQVNESSPDEIQIAQYDSARKEMEKYLESKGMIIPKERVKEISIVPGTEDLPF